MTNILFEAKTYSDETITGYYAKGNRYHYIITEISDEEHAVYGCCSKDVKLRVINPDTLKMVNDK